MASQNDNIGFANYNSLILLQFITNIPLGMKKLRIWHYTSSLSTYLTNEETIPRYEL